MIKRILAIIMSIVLVFSLAACGKKDNSAANAPENKPAASADQQSAANEGSSSGSAASSGNTAGAVAADYAQGNPVPKDSGAKWYIKNGLTYDFFEESGPDYYGNRMEIKGLKNKDIQNAINQEINDVYTRLMSDDYFPPYPDAEKNIKKLDADLFRYVDVQLNSSINNMLSVDVHLEISKEVPLEDDMMFNMRIMEDYPLNYDLNTGKKIKLTDMFSDDVDALSYSKETMEKMIADNEEGYVFTDISFKSPFKGFSEDQKFFFGDGGDCVGLIFDYDIPEYDYTTNNSEYDEYYDTRNIYISLNGVSALADRFFKEGQPSLFEDESQILILRSNSFNEIGSRYVSERVGTDDTNFWYGYITYPDMPDAAMTYIENSRQDAFDLYDMMKKDLDSQGDGIFDVFGNLDVSASRCGDYTMLSKSGSYTIYDEDWTEVAYYSLPDETVCYKGDSTQPLTVKDLFKPGVDYKELIKLAFEKSYEKNFYGSIDIDLGNPDHDNLMNDIIDSIAGINIMEYCISFTYKDFDSIINKYYPQTKSEYGYDYDDNYWAYQTYCNAVEYEDLGFENLTIFE